MLVDVRPGLRNHLLTDANIAALVSTRIFPVRNAEGNRNDCIVYIRILENESYHFIGRTGLCGARFQIDSWSLSTDKANQIANLVKERISGFSGVWNYGASSPSDIVNVQGVFMQTGFEDVDAETLMYRMSRDYMIWYEDTP
jgi:hypothetical protein